MKTVLRYSIFIIVTGFFSFRLCAQNITVSAGTDKQEYLIGDYIRLNITVHNITDNQFAFPLIDSLPPQMEIITISPIDTIKNQNDTQLKQQIVYSIYDSGVYKINPIRIQYQRKGDTTKYFASTDTLRFIVNTLPVDTTQAIKPIKPIIEVNVKSKLGLYIFMGLVTAILIIILVYIFRRNRKKRPKPEIIITPETLYQQTVHRLQELENKKLWQHEHIKEYYIELTDILRDYIELRFKLPAMESTTEEIIELLVRAGIQKEQVNHMQFILHSADFAKFAKSKPMPAENIQAMQYAAEFVNTTKEPDNKAIQEDKKPHGIKTDTNT